MLLIVFFAFFRGLDQIKQFIEGINRSEICRYDATYLPLESFLPPEKHQESTVMNTA